MLCPAVINKYQTKCKANKQGYLLQILKDTKVTLAKVTKCNTTKIRKQRSVGRTKEVQVARTDQTVTGDNDSAAEVSHCPMQPIIKVALQLCVLIEQHISGAHKRHIPSVPAKDGKFPL